MVCLEELKKKNGRSIEANQHLFLTSPAQRGGADSLVGFVIDPNDGGAAPSMTENIITSDQQLEIEGICAAVFFSVKNLLDPEEEAGDPEAGEITFEPVDWSVSIVRERKNDR